MDSWKRQKELKIYCSLHFMFVGSKISFFILKLENDLNKKGRGGKKIKKKENGRKKERMRSLCATVAHLVPVISC